MICSISPSAKASIGLVGMMPEMTSQNEGASSVSMPEVSTPVMSNPRPGPINWAIPMATLIASAVVVR